MQYRALLCALTLMVAACDAGPGRPSPLPVPSVLVTPSPPPPPSPPPSPPPVGTRLIALGEAVKESIAEQPRNYIVVTPVAGTLLVHLEWFEQSGAVTLRLAADGREVSWQCGEFSPWPVEARVAVVASQQVLITVSRGGGCWDYVAVSREPGAAEPMDFVVRTKMAG